MSKWADKIVVVERPPPGPPKIKIPKPPKQPKPIKPPKEEHHIHHGKPYPFDHDVVGDPLIHSTNVKHKRSIWDRITGKNRLPPSRPIRPPFERPPTQITADIDIEDGYYSEDFDRLSPPRSIMPRSRSPSPFEMPPQRIDANINIEERNSMYDFDRLPPPRPIRPRPRPISPFERPPQHIDANINIEKRPRPRSRSSYWDDIDLKRLRNKSLWNDIDLEKLKRKSLWDDIDLEKLKKKSLWDDLDISKLREKQNKSLWDDIDISKLRENRNKSLWDDIDLRRLSSESDDENEAFHRRFKKIQSIFPIQNYEPPLPIGNFIMPHVYPITIFELNELRRKNRKQNFDSVPNFCKR